MSGETEVTYFQSLVWIVLAVCSALASGACAKPEGESSGTARELASEAPRQRYVRVPREFFEGAVVARIIAGASAGPSSELFDGGATWTELPPRDPAPRGDAIADFRNFPGCAGFPGESVRLCFDVMPDVSNLGVNAEELSAPGLAEWLASRDPECVGARAASFESGERSGESSFSATFRVECGEEARRVKFVLSQA